MVFDVLAAVAEVAVVAEVELEEPIEAGMVAEEC